MEKMEHTEPRRRSVAPREPTRTPQEPKKVDSTSQAPIMVPISDPPQVDWNDFYEFMRLRKADALKKPRAASEHSEHTAAPEPTPELAPTRETQRKRWKIILAAALFYIGCNLFMAALTPNEQGKCPPHFMHHVSDLNDFNPVIGLPPRSFPSWWAPTPVVDERNNALLNCLIRIAGSDEGSWSRTDYQKIQHVYAKAINAYREVSGSLNGTRHALGVLKDKEDMQHRYEENAWIPNEGPPLTRWSMIPDFNVNIPHFTPSCARKCGTFNVVSDVFYLALIPSYLWSTPQLPMTPKSAKHAACRCLVNRMQSIRLWWAMIPPRHHPAWADPLLNDLARSYRLSSLFYAPLQAWALGWPEYKRKRKDVARTLSCWVPHERRVAWVQAGWAKHDEFAPCDYTPAQERMSKDMKKKQEKRRAAWRICLLNNKAQKDKKNYTGIVDCSKIHQIVGDDFARDLKEGPAPTYGWDYQQ
jgi:hypothetical protein